MVPRNRRVPECVCRGDANSVEPLDKHAIGYGVVGRHLVLAFGTAAVLGVGVYLFVQVRATPAPPPTVERPVASRPMPLAAPPAAAPTPAEAPAPTPQAAVAAPPPIDASTEPPPAFGITDRELEVIMANANRSYDHGDYDEARQFAGQVLIRQPSNARMLRILVSSACIEGDATTAQASMTQLPAADQEQMRVRCQRYGINLTVSAGQ